MKRVKQYRIRLTEEEDELLKQKARETGLSVADIIRLGVKYQIQDLEAARANELIKNSKFVQNWEQNFETSLFQEFGKRWQDTLKFAYITALSKYKNSVRYIDEKFEIVTSFQEIEEIEEEILVDEVEPEIISEDKVKENVCQSLTRFVGGEWNGDEWIVQMMISGLKLDLANSRD
ncbi:MAG: ribbon-helix-helix protein, CopG family [Hydrococcus sp. Prado102]|jgi:predicted DNA-binding protein|nr:ribbon-helix-helix protein, CopG family [Hydrococcus sp. Prado102]